MDAYAFPIPILAILVGTIQWKYPFSIAEPPNQDIYGGPKNQVSSKNRIDYSFSEREWLGYHLWG
jgi:hypothetical protein